MIGPSICKINTDTSYINFHDNDYHYIAGTLNFFPVEFMIFHSVITHPFVVLNKWAYSFKLTVFLSSCYFCTSQTVNKLRHKNIFEIYIHAFTNIVRFSYGICGSEDGKDAEYCPKVRHPRCV